MTVHRDYCGSVIRYTWPSGIPDGLGVHNSCKMHVDGDNTENFGIKGRFGRENSQLQVSCEPLQLRVSLSSVVVELLVMSLMLVKVSYNSGIVLTSFTIRVVIVQLSWYQVDIMMSEGSNADIVDIEEKCIVNDKPE